MFDKGDNMHKHGAVGGGSSRILSASTFLGDERLLEDVDAELLNRARSKSTLTLNRRHAQSNYFNLDQDGPLHMRESLEALRHGVAKVGAQIHDPEYGDGGDIFEFLALRFGFQRGNVDNQKEHLALLIANIRVRAKSRDSVQADVRALHRKFFGNYIQWCRFLGLQTIFSRETPEMDIALYLLVWGEAGNLRFCPECICFIYHNMAKKLYTQQGPVERSIPGSFLEEVVKPLYVQLAKMKQFKKPDGGLAEHTKVRNYDDFNEFFWSRACLRFDERTVALVLDKNYQKTFQEKRSIFNPFLGYIRIFKFHLWIFHLSVALAYVAWLGTPNTQASVNGTAVNSKRTHQMPSGLDIYSGIWDALTTNSTTDQAQIALFSVVITFAVIAVFKVLLELWIGGLLVFGNTSYGFALFVRLVWHSIFVALSLAIVFSPATALAGSFTLLNTAPIVAGVYLLPQILWSFLAFSPNAIRNSSFWQYVRRGRDQYVGHVRQSFKTVMRYSLFWVVLWLAKIWVSFQFFICPIMGPTMEMVELDPKEIAYPGGWPLQFSNIGVILAFWLPTVIVFFYDAQIWFAVLQGFAGAILGWKKKIGDAHNLRDVRKRLQMAPFLFDQKIVTRIARHALGAANRPEELKSQSRLRFAVVWNECINSFRLADLLDDREATVMQYDIRDKGLVNDPIFLTAGSVEKAIDIAEKYRSKNNDGPLRNKLHKQGCLSSAYGCYTAVREVVLFLTDNDPAIAAFFDLVDRHCRDLMLSRLIKFNKMRVISQALVEFLGAILDMPEPTYLEAGNVAVHRASEMSAVLDRFEELIYQISQASQAPNAYDLSSCRILDRQRGGAFAAEQLRKLYDDRNAMAMASRAFLMLTVEAIDALPRCEEARRRIGYFLHSLSMDIPSVDSIKDSHSFCVITPYYAEPVIYSIEDLNTPVQKSNPIFAESEQLDRMDITILQYLTTVYPDEWGNFLERMGVHSVDEAVGRTPMEVRLWASYRGQTLARTVRGMMLYEDAIKMLHWLEIGGDESISHDIKIRRMDEMVRLKFSYVTGCQVYGWQKANGHQQAEDIDFLMKMYPNWRVAYVDEISSPDGNAANCKFSAVLVKSENNEIVEVYRYELPGNPILGEGKPENQNVALAFSRGEFVQTIDMNQEHYFEETLKIANFLATADRLVDGAPPTIIGMREHIFTGSASSLSTFMAWQELVFVTLNQRVLADPLRVRMHYGHPDFFDKIFAITRGGLSKPSKGINLSEDIFAGFNTTVRGGLVIHEEFMQCGKGRDVALTQITLFETKIANGNAESSLSRDIHRMGSTLDFFRLCSMYYAHNGFYINTTLTVFGIFMFMFSKVYLSLQGEVLRDIVENIGQFELNQLDNVLNTQFILQLGWLFTLPLFLCLMTEKGVLKAVGNLLTLIITMGPLFYSFQMGTRHHFYMEGLLRGGAKYRATGRGFTISRDPMPEIFMRYSMSHFRMGWELVGLLIIYGILGTVRVCAENGLETNNDLVVLWCKTPQNYGVASFAVYFIAICFILSPFLFNTEGFEYRKTKQDIGLWFKWMFAPIPLGDKPDAKKAWQVWIGEEWAQYICMSSSSRVALLLRESRHFMIAYIVWISYFDYQSFWVPYAGAMAILGILTLIGLAVRLTNIPVFVKATVYALVYVVTVVLAGVGVQVFSKKENETDFNHMFTALVSSLTCLYGIMYCLLAFNHYKAPLGTSFFIQEISFFFDFLAGSTQAIILFLLSAIPFVSVMQARMMYNKGFTRAISGASQYAISVFFVTGMLSGFGTGMIMYITGGFNIDMNFVKFLEGIQKSNPSGVDFVVKYLSPASNAAAAVGVLIAGLLLGLIGRRKTVIAACVLSISGGILAGVASNNSLLGVTVGFPLMGLAAGMLSLSVPLYNFEISTLEHRGKGVLTFLVGMTVGNLTMASLAGIDQLQAKANIWKLNLLYANIPLLLMIFVSLYFVESPLYLYKKFGRAACEDCLIRLRRRHDVHSELELIASQLSLPSSAAPMVPRRILIILLQVAFAISTSTFIFYQSQNAPVAEQDTGNGATNFVRFNRIAYPLFYALGVGAGLAMVDRVKRKTILKDGLPLVILCAGVVLFAVGYQQYSVTETIRTVYTAFFVLLVLVGATSYGTATWVSAMEVFPAGHRLANVVPGFFIYWLVQAALYLVNLDAAVTKELFQDSLYKNLLIPLIVYVAVSVPIVVMIFGMFASTASGAICMKSEKAARLAQDNLIESPALSTRSSARFRFKGNSVREGGVLSSHSGSYSFLETPKEISLSFNGVHQSELIHRENGARHQVQR